MSDWFEERGLLLLRALDLPESESNLRWVMAYACEADRRAREECAKIAETEGDGPYNDYAPSRIAAAICATIKEPNPHGLSSTTAAMALLASGILTEVKEPKP